MRTFGMPKHMFLRERRDSVSRTAGNLIALLVFVALFWVLIFQVLLPLSNIFGEFLNDLDQWHSTASRL